MRKSSDGTALDFGLGDDSTSTCILQDDNCKYSGTASNLPSVKLQFDKKYTEGPQKTRYLQYTQETYSGPELGC